MMLLSVTMPGGLIDEQNVLHNSAVIEPLSGREEELLADSKNLNPAQVVNRVISGCVRNIGCITDISPDIAGKLLVGDRQFLLLKLRELTFGKQVDAIVPCPVPQCRKPMEITFLTSDIPVRSLQRMQKSYTFRIVLNEDAGNGWNGKSIVYRLPNGNDQEIVGAVALDNAAEGLHLLLKRCVLEIDGLPVENSEKIPPVVAWALEKEMEKNAPGLDLNIETQCPECGSDVSFPFALQEFFFGELSINKDQLYREIHYLAYHYHWSEQELLSLTRNKRRTYISILSDEIERMNSAGD